MPDAVKVLNGVVRVGDKVAFAVREGNNGAIRVGEVVDIVDTGRTRWHYDREAREGEYAPIIRVKIRVEHTSGWTKVGSVVGVEIHDRIVKMCPAGGESHPEWQACR